jgi:hypothetical protein
MMQNTRYLAIALVGAVMLSACNTDRSLATASEPTTSPNGIAADVATLKDKGDAQIVSATGDIVGAVEEFRDLLGPLNPNVPGEQPAGDPGGRREINWDGVPAGFTNNDLFPANFFNSITTSPRGVVYSTDGTGFRVGTADGFTNLNPSYAGEFTPFSGGKMFVSRGSTVTDIHFFVAGSTTPALVTGFGSVFEDVGRAHSTTIEFYGADGNRLLEIVAPRASDERGLSFAGAAFASPVVAWVRITAGDTPIGADDNVKGAGKKDDVVVMDDFIYGEPRATGN